MSCPASEEIEAAPPPPVFPTRPQDESNGGAAHAESNARAGGVWDGGTSSGSGTSRGMRPLVIRAEATDAAERSEWLALLTAAAATDEVDEGGGHYAQQASEGGELSAYPTAHCGLNEEPGQWVGFAAPSGAINDACNAAPPGQPAGSYWGGPERTPGAHTDASAGSELAAALGQPLGAETSSTGAVAVGAILLNAPAAPVAEGSREASQQQVKSTRTSCMSFCLPALFRRRSSEALQHQGNAKI